MGRDRTRVLFAVMVYGAYAVLVGMAIGWSPWVLLPLVSIPLAAGLVRLVRTHTDGPTLNEALARTGMVQLLFCVLLSAGILLA
jgi:1,4-dihydroxy-2-naphthoate octaprenyltransferase